MDLRLVILMFVCVAAVYGHGYGRPRHGHGYHGHLHHGHRHHIHHRSRYRTSFRRCRGYGGYRSRHCKSISRTTATTRLTTTKAKAPTTTRTTTTKPSTAATETTTTGTPPTYASKISTIDTTTTGTPPTKADGKFAFHFSKYDVLDDIDDLMKAVMSQLSEYDEDDLADYDDVSKQESINPSEEDFDDGEYDGGKDDEALPDELEMISQFSK